MAKCMTWSLIADDTRTLYKDAIKLSKLEGLEPREEQLVTDMVKKESKPLEVHSLPIHESLRLILDRMILEGDSEALRNAIDVHLREHSANPRANEANYLLVLYAALGKSVPLLDYLVSVKEMPLKYSFKAYVEKNYVMSFSDLKSERDILKFAASELKRHGQPLDSFAQLFALNSGPAKRIVERFVREYHRYIPTDNYDEALAKFAKSNELALLGYTAPKASKQVRADVFVKSDNVRVLQVVLALPGVSHAQLGAKLGRRLERTMLQL